MRTQEEILSYQRELEGVIERHRLRPGDTPDFVIELKRTWETLHWCLGNSWFDTYDAEHPNDARAAEY